MQQYERLGPRLFVGAILGAVWSLFPAKFLHGHELACFVAGIPTGMFVTWLYTCTTLEMPVIYGPVLLPVGSMLFGLLFGLMYSEPVVSTFSEPLPFYAWSNWWAIHFTAWLFHPLVLVVVIAPAIASTCLLTLIFRKRRPRRRDLLPERWDG